MLPISGSAGKIGAIRAQPDIVNKTAPLEMATHERLVNQLPYDPRWWTARQEFVLSQINVL